MEYLVAFLVLFVLVLLLLLFRSGRNGTGGSDQLLQQQMESLRTEVRESIRGVTENLNQHLSMVGQQVQAQTGMVGLRLDSATRVIGEVQKSLGELGVATGEIKALGQNVLRLDELLRAPKLRGGLGEYLLDELLRQVIPQDHIQMQYQFRSGHTVDAVVQTSDRMIPIDAKFPLENFRKMTGVVNEADRKSHQRAFITDVRKHIDAIASKYILPDEGTFPFALMYIPSESVYYELIVKDEPDSGLHGYGLERNVIPVSPNSLYAYLQVIALGLRGMVVEERAKEILAMLTRLQNDALRVREVFTVLGTHMENARKKYDELDKRLVHVEGHLESAGARPVAEAGPELLSSDREVAAFR